MESPVLVTSREGRVSRNRIIDPHLRIVGVTSREGRLSTNQRYHTRDRIGNSHVPRGACEYKWMRYE